jgi:hypothetical protein
MRILPDAKDLINTVEHDKGVTFNDLERFLTQGNHEVVLTSTNVLEFAASLSDTDDFLQMRRLLQKLENLQLRYIKETTIPLEELRAAKFAYDSGTHYREIDPYVARWDETISLVGEPASTEPLVALRLDEIIYMIWKKDRTALQFPKHSGKLIRSHYEEKRQTTPAPRMLAKKEFGKYVEQQFRYWGIDASGTDLDALGDWVYSDPARCPGLRMYYDMCYELLGAITDKMKDNDTQDFAYLYAIPYIDAITFDRRIRGYAASVAQRLKKLNPHVDYTNRLFQSFESVMKASR